MQVVQSLLGFVSALSGPCIIVALYCFYFRAALGKPAARTPASPSRHPEPLARWTRRLCSLVDNGGFWLDEAPARATQMLRDWNVHDRRSWAAKLHALLVTPRDRGIGAWNGVGAIRVLMAGARLGYCAEQVAWGVTRAIGVEMAVRYYTFNDVQRDYLRQYRRWAGLPLDASADDAWAQSAAFLLAQEHYDFEIDVTFTACFDAAPYPGLRDIDEVLAALASVQQPAPRPTARPPAVPPLKQCVFCRASFRGALRVCPNCGAPTAEAITLVRRGQTERAS